MNRKIILFVIAAVLVLAVFTDAEAKKGFYIGLGATYNTIQGDFNGNSGLQNETDVIIEPEIQSAVGIDIRGGYGFNDQWALELNLMSSGHNGEWMGRTGTVSYTSFSINGKYSFSSSDSTQPYLLFGISNNMLLIKNGATDTATGETGDATLEGAGVNIGAGIDQYLSQHMSLNLGVLYRFVDYTYASGVNRSGSIEDGVNGSGFSFLLTTAYHF